MVGKFSEVQNSNTTRYLNIDRMVILFIQGCIGTLNKTNKSLLYLRDLRKYKFFDSGQKIQFGPKICLVKSRLLINVFQSIDWLNDFKWGMQNFYIHILCGSKGFFKYARKFEKKIIVDVFYKFIFIIIYYFLVK